MNARSPFDYPIVTGEYQITPEWKIRLPHGEFRRRFEDGSLVIWRPGLTAWIAVWDASDEDVYSRLRKRKARASTGAYSPIEESTGDIVRFSYRLKESPSGIETDMRDAQAPSLNAFVFGATGDVQMGIYFDEEEEVHTALAMWRGVEEGVAALQ